MTRRRQGDNLTGGGLDDGKPKVDQQGFRSFSFRHSFRASKRNAGAQHVAVEARGDEWAKGGEAAAATTQ